MEALFAAPVGALLLFLLRMVDVSMATTRMILSVRGHRVVAASIAFFEVFIWLIAAGHALQHLGSVLHMMGYAAGFATGNFVGVWIEGRLAIGLNVVHAICMGKPVGEGIQVGQVVAGTLRENGYAVTELEGQGKDGGIDFLNIFVLRRQVPEVVRLLKKHDPGVFITVEEVRASHGGYIRPGGRKTPSLQFP